MGCYLIAPLFDRPRKSILSAQVGEVANFVLYISQMQIGGAITLLLSIIRGSAALWVSDKLLIKILIINVAVLWGIFLYRLEYPYDLLLACAGTCIALAQYNRDNFWMFRLFVVISQSLWIVHSLLTGMYTMTISSLAIILTITWSIFYHKMPELKEFFQCITTPHRTRKIV